MDKPHLVAVTLVTFLASCTIGTDDDQPVDLDRGDTRALCVNDDDECDFGCAVADTDCTPTELTRADQVIAEIAAFNAELSPAAQADKYCTMRTSPFVFFRGTNHLFWSDFAGDPRFASFGGPDTRIFLQGDLHVLNYGSFDNDEGRVVYDMNDFDEVVIADYQWDVWRMAVSMVLANGDLGYFSPGQVDEFIDAFSEFYLDSLASYRGRNDELSRDFDRTSTYGRLDEFLATVESDSTRDDMLRKWTDENGGIRVFDYTYEKLAQIEPDVYDALVAAVSEYTATTGGGIADIPGYFDVKDIARRLHAGTGSLGVARYYVLIEGETGDTDDDRILDVKRQPPPSAYPYLSAEERALLDEAASTDAVRAVLGYRALLADADDHLGWLSLPDIGDEVGGVFSVRERSPYKETFPLADLNTDTRFEKLSEQWGAILATAHARADKDYRDDIISYSFDKNVDEYTDGMHAEFRAQVRDIAHSYAAQVEMDYRAFTGLLATAELCSAGP